ncbi:hypothetical protein [Pseudidiomarina sp.]|uniref:hypothetical protein n=1 Tax=Pseudidiomarina sp. TaxID=2081707 RepID=UPI003A9874C8
MTKSQQQLLWIAAILAALQFGVKPIIAWQNSLITELTLNEARIERSEQLLASEEEINTAANTAAALANEVREKFPVASESSLLQIELQSSIEEQLRASQVSLQEFAWLTSLQQDGSGLGHLRARVRFAGDIGRLTEAQFQLQSAMPNAIHESMELRRDNRRRGAYVMTLQLRVNVQSQQQGGGA